MRVKGTALAFCVLFGAAGAAPGAEAAESWQDPSSQAGTPAREVVAHKPAPRAGKPGRSTATSHRRSNAQTSSGISCVPYARQVTGMAVSGDGWQWWRNAAGLYARGQQPEPGSVLTFRSSGGMTHGHVAVVSQVLGPRHVLIDHANWAGPGIRRGSVMHDVSVIDVSEDNDWTAVRVQSGYNSSAFGRTYATYGFIYNRPDGDTGTAFAGLPHRWSTRIEQVAEMPAQSRAQSFRPQGTSAWR